MVNISQSNCLQDNWKSPIFISLEICWDSVVQKTLTTMQGAMDTTPGPVITSDCSFRKKKGTEGKEKEVEREPHHASSDKIRLEFQRRGKEGGTEGRREKLYLFL